MCCCYPYFTICAPTFANATPDRQEKIRLLYETITLLVYTGLWKLLEVLMAGVWWLRVGYAMRSFNKTIGWVTIVLGAFTILDGIGNIFGLHLLAEMGLMCTL